MFSQLMIRNRDPDGVPLLHAYTVVCDHDWLMRMTTREITPRIQDWLMIMSTDGITLGKRACQEGGRNLCDQRSQAMDDGFYCLPASSQLHSLG